MDRRKLQAYASLAEVISALAVVITVLYVGYEFRRSSTVSSREADLILFERTRESNRLLIESPGLAEIIVAARTAPEEMSEADRLRFLAYQHDFFDTWEIGWYYHDVGILDTQTWVEWDEWFTDEARRRPRFGWTENRQNFTGGPFRAHVDSLLSVG